MYVGHFGMRTRPFRAGIDCYSYYAATTHEQALARLAQAILDDEGLCLLTGAAGTGKSLLCQCLLERLAPRINGVYLSNSHLPSRVALLQAVCFDLAIPFENRSEQELRLALTGQLLECYATGRRTVVVVDEAQHLSIDLLEEFRLLSNLEGETAKALQVVLAALPEFTDALQRPEMTAFRQRLAVRVHLEPFGPQEAADYLMHQMRVAGAAPEQIFTDEAIETLARATAGIPRRINQVAHQALMLAFENNSSVVDVEAVLEALAILNDVAPVPTAAPPCTLHLAADPPLQGSAPHKPPRARRRSPAPNKSDRRPA